MCVRHSCGFASTAQQTILVRAAEPVTDPTLTPQMDVECSGGSVAATPRERPLVLPTTACGPYTVEMTEYQDTLARPGTACRQPYIHDYTITGLYVVGGWWGWSLLWLLWSWWLSREEREQCVGVVRESGVSLRKRKRKGE